MSSNELHPLVDPKLADKMREYLNDAQRELRYVARNMAAGFGGRLDTEESNAYASLAQAVGSVLSADELLDGWCSGGIYDELKKAITEGDVAPAVEAPAPRLPAKKRKVAR